ncbi:MAG: TRAP transporter large permease subunit [Treponema sp.]|nr:TRAP transporter large permease subunit [Treponema sp.]
MLKKIEDAFAVALVAILSVTALVIKIMQDNLHLQVMNADMIIVNIAFVFACVAGLITWRENRALSLANITEKLPQKARGVIKAVASFATAVIITQLFLASFLQVANPDQFTNKVLMFAEKVYFAFYPLCFLMILILLFQNSKGKLSLAATIVGTVFGVLTSMSAVTGIIWYWTENSNLPALYALADAWNAFCDKTVLLWVIVLIALAFTGVPLFVVISGITYVIFSKAGGYIDVIPIEAYSKLADKSIAAIPLFTIAGYVLAQGSAGKRFVELFRALFGWFRGGTVVAAVLVLTFFSTFTGVSGVTILALGSLLAVILTGSGYEKDRAESLITSSGAVGLLFPPSVAIIMYASSNYTVITQFEPGFDVITLFVGALIPGCLMAFSMIALGIVFDNNKNRPRFSISQIGKSFLNCLPELILPVLICVTYFTGFFNLFQVSSFAVIYAVALVFLFRRDFNVKKTARVIADSVPVSGGILFIIAAAAALSYWMQDANIPETVTAFITTYVKNKFLFLLLMNLALLVVGCLMDIYSAILLVSPLFLYSAAAFGIPVVQAGVIFIMNLSIGFLTPPVGMDLFISSYTFKKPVGQVIKGVLPFLIVQLIVLLLVTYVPAFTTCLIK